MLSIIAAVSENNVIGNRGKIPWHLPADLKYFKARTTGHPVIMGSRTYESLGKPLPGRTNIVLSDIQDYRAEGCIIAHSFKGALEAARRAPGAEEIFIIGGASVYAQALPLANRLYLTRVHEDVEGDVSFPAYAPSEWREERREEHQADAQHPHRYTFFVFERK